MTKQTKTQLQANYSTFLPDNSTGAISPSDIRTQFVDTSDSYAHLDDVRREVISTNTLTQTLADATTIAWDAASGPVATVTLGGNRTVNFPTNTENGQKITLVVIQDATGSRTITWNGNYYWAGGTAPTLSTAGGSADVLQFQILTLNGGLRCVNYSITQHPQTSGGGGGPAGGG